MERWPAAATLVCVLLGLLLLGGGLVDGAASIQARGGSPDRVPGDDPPQAGGGGGTPAAPAALPLDTITLPAGFRIDVYAAGVKNARSLALGANGTVFVGSRTAGNVYALVDQNRDQKADRVVTIATGLNQPNGVAFREGSLYVAEISRVLRYDGIESALDAPPPPVVVTDRLPTDKHHGWKFIAFGPDGWLYVPIGAPCNICDERRRDRRYASITRMKADGTGAEVFAEGVRNTVGFDWHPSTKQLWFTDNGRDWLGDDQPPDELNVAPGPGLDFGFPVLPRRHDQGPGARTNEGLPGYRGAGAGAGPARRGPGDALLLRVHVPGGVSPTSLHRGARLVEPLDAGGLPRDAGEARSGWQGHHLRTLCRRVVAGPQRVGASSGCAGDARRSPPRVRRQGGRRLPDLVRALSRDRERWGDPLRARQGARAGRSWFQGNSAATALLAVRAMNPP